MNREMFRPPPALTVSEWADAYRYLSSEGSPEPGKWFTSRAEYQREMMDAVKNTERIVIMSAAQVGKSELLLNTLGYFIHYEPCPILMIQPTLSMGEAFSKERLAPMIRDTPVLTVRFPDPKSRTSGNTLLQKVFPGGYVTIAGANSPSGLASRPIRVLLCDEIDRYPESAGSEGDPVSIATQRTANFWNRRIVCVSTPTMKGISRIEEAFSLSTKEEWSIPCPSCGEFQPYIWDNVVYKDRTQPVMRCRKCGHEHSEVEWKSNVGKWIPGRQATTRGFHMNALASPWVSWQEIVNKYIEAYKSGEEKLKTWVNMTLGEPYEPSVGVIDIQTLAGNLEDYDAQVPKGAYVLTCGIDTQDDRLEIEVVGWGLNNESYGIEYKIIYGNPSDIRVWKELDAYLSKPFRKANGELLLISCACIDSAGHHTDDVYKFCKPRIGRRIFPIVGRGRYGMPSVQKPNRNNRLRIPLFTLGVSTIKGILHSRLQAKKGENGYCHFPNDGKTGYDTVYFSGLLSERMVFKRRRGVDTVIWEKRSENARNEPLDCRVYAIGAFEILSPNMERHAKMAREDERNAQTQTQTQDDTQQPPKEQIQTQGQAQRTVRHSGKRVLKHAVRLNMLRRGNVLW